MSNGASFSRGTVTRPSRSFLEDLYAAETPGEGMRAVTNRIPVWVLLTVGATAVGGYAVSLKLRIWLARWRQAERERTRRKYEGLYDSRGCSPQAMHEYLVDEEEYSMHSLRQFSDGDEEGNESIAKHDALVFSAEDGDDSGVSIQDIEEFRTSLGIQLPRDDDLLQLVEEMLVVDPIPDGWVLFRTPGGFLRFMNVETEELLFFHPSAHQLGENIRSQLNERNKKPEDPRAMFFPSTTTRRLRSVSRSQRSISIQGSRGQEFENKPDFSTVTLSNGVDDDGSTFHQLFNYFVQRERSKIEEEVAQSYQEKIQTTASTPRRVILPDEVSSRVRPAANTSGASSRPSTIARMFSAAAQTLSGASMTDRRRSKVNE